MAGSVTSDNHPASILASCIVCTWFNRRCATSVTCTTEHYLDSLCNRLPKAATHNSKCIVVKWVDVAMVFNSWLRICRLRGAVQADQCCWQRLRRYLRWNPIAFLGPAQCRAQNNSTVRMNRSVNVWHTWRHFDAVQHCTTRCAHTAQSPANSVHVLRCF